MSESAELMEFEISNPSDYCTMKARDLEVAAVAVCILGNGAYGLDGIGKDEGKGVPIFLFGGHDEWFKEKFGRTLDESETLMESKPAELADCLESVSYRQGRERTSMNDIRGRAHSLAKHLREVKP